MPALLAVPSLNAPPVGATFASDAHRRFGKGSSHAVGDCCTQLLAKTRNVPPLFKGDDFIHTDIVPALKPA
jgi:ribonuclease VapC